jgi:hypothetical protein
MKVSTTDNSSLAKGGLMLFVETSVLKQIVLLRMSFGAKIPPFAKPQTVVGHMIEA